MNKTILEISIIRFLYRKLNWYTLHGPLLLYCEGDCYSVVNEQPGE